MMPWNENMTEALRDGITEDLVPADSMELI
jgi:hypothetical protein